MVKNDSQVTPSLYRGNIAIILIIIIAWLPHILFFLQVEFSIYIDNGYIFIGFLTLCVASVIYCKYMWPIVIIFAMGVFHWDRGMLWGQQSLWANSDAYMLYSEVQLYKQGYREWDTVVNYYAYYFEYMQQAVLASVLFLLAWWFCRSHRLGRLLSEDIKYFWTNKIPGKNLRIILVLILAFIMSIPYWGLFMYTQIT